MEIKRSGAQPSGILLRPATAGQEGPAEYFTGTVSNGVAGMGPAAVETMAWQASDEKKPRGRRSGLRHPPSFSYARQEATAWQAEVRNQKSEAFRSCQRG